MKKLITLIALISLSTMSFASKCSDQDFAVLQNKFNSSDTSTYADQLKKEKEYLETNYRSKAKTDEAYNFSLRIEDVIKGFSTVINTYNELYGDMIQCKSHYYRSEFEENRMVLDILSDVYREHRFDLYDMKRNFIKKQKAYEEEQKNRTLHECVSQEDISCTVKFLRNPKLQINNTDENGNTALDLAMEIGNKHIIYLLEPNKAKYGDDCYRKMFNKYLGLGLNYSKSSNDASVACLQSH